MSKLLPLRLTQFLPARSSEVSGVKQNCEFALHADFCVNFTNYEEQDATENVAALSKSLLKTEQFIK